MSSNHSPITDGTGRVALVLGAIKGIGKGIALDLVRRGFSVALTYHDWTEALPRLQADLDDFADKSALFEVDLRDCAAVFGLVKGVLSRFGRLDILVNNIERGGWPIVHGPYTPDQWDLEMETTLRAKRWVFDAALPHLKAAGEGAVINFSSIAGIVGRSGPARLIFNDGYAAANRGISLLTETWARIGAPEVRVNEIMLGFFETRHGTKTRGWGLLNARQKKALLDHTPLNRTGRIEDAVRAVLYIIRDAPFMTGTVLRLDGGYVLGAKETGDMPKGVL